MATSKLTNAQQKVFDKLIRDYDEANNMDFETWAWKSNWCGGGFSHHSFDEVIDALRWFGKRDCPKNVDGYVEEKLARLRKKYENFRAGILHTVTSSNTLRAMEKKGYIEIIEDTANSCYDFDTVKLLCTK